MTKRQIFNSFSFKTTLIVFSMLFIVSCTSSTQKEERMDVPYKNPKLPVEERVEDLLSRMTLEEKIDQLSGQGFDTLENKRLGIPALKMSDGPVGVRWGNATAFPAAVGIAAAWNPQLASKIGAAAAEELKSKGRNFLLGPCVNIHRHPLGGRNFESYGEDPFLAAKTAAGFIKGVQSRDILACVKHYALNNQEWERHKVDVAIDERGLREIYLPAFKAAVKEADVWTVMAAYNVFRGDHCSESQYLLDQILKKEWGFRGFVVSDWRSTYSTVKTAKAGLDLEMPWGTFFGGKLLEAVKKGDVSPDIIDDKVRRLMRVRFRARLFDTPAKVDGAVIKRPEHKTLALESARQSIVLLKNQNNCLPLDKSKIKTIAVIGPNAMEARVGGGGSSKVTPLYAVSPLEGLKKAAGKDIQFKYAHGTPILDDIQPLPPRFVSTVPPGQNSKKENKNGFWAEYFSNIKLEGTPVMARLDRSVNFNWGYDAPHPKLHRVDDRNVFSVRWTGTLHPPVSGQYKLNVLHYDGLRVYIDDKPVIDNWKKNDLASGSASVTLTGGKDYPIRIEYFFDGGISMVKFGWERPGHDPLKEAVQLAKDSDAAVIFAGLHERFETESYDRPRLELPNQDALIKAVAKVNPNTIVVMETGSAVLMEPWINDVAAAVQAWFPGQEGGNAIAQVLLGQYNPGGKLPFSMIASYKQTPAFDGYKDKSLKSEYKEGLFVGYRYLDKHNHQPTFPFGHGLSYTTFQYHNLKIQPLDGKPYTYSVSLDIENTGKRRGTEVVQLYIKDIQSSLERPEKELKGFQKVFLEPGEKKTVSIRLDKDSFAFYHPGKKQWVVEPGEFLILIGSSSKDIRLKGQLTL